jgi:hypothetical protein
MQRYLFFASLALKLRKPLYFVIGNRYARSIISSNPYREVDVELGESKRSSMIREHHQQPNGHQLQETNDSSNVNGSNGNHELQQESSPNQSRISRTRRASVTSGVEDHLSIGVECNVHPYKILWVNLGQISCERMIEQRRKDRTYILWSFRLLSNHFAATT